MGRAPFPELIGQIAGLQNRERLEWALTGSASFRIQGMDVEPPDIDIQTDARSAYAVQRLLGGTVLQPVSFSAAARIRSHFGRMLLRGWVVEIMGDLEKLHTDGTWTEAPDLARIRRFVHYAGQSIPVLDLAYELEAYEILGRPERAAMLREFLASRPEEGSQ